MIPQRLGAHLSPGIWAALVSALLFGASTPFAKILTGDVSPILLAGLLYLGSGVGLGLWAFARGRNPTMALLSKRDLPWLASAVILGGIVAPVFLMSGIATTPGSTASLLLNLEAVFTAFLAWCVFRENFDKRIAAGMVLIVLGGMVLSWQAGGGFMPSVGWLAIVGACFCWALDNNFTQKISAADPLQIAAIKGLVAGTSNVVAALLMGSMFPGATVVGAALGVGLAGYGMSLVLFVVALRNLGTARTSAYFSIAPFVGAVFSLILFDEIPGPSLVVAGLFMAAGVWLHLAERHIHEHEHPALFHSHSHSHDEHHQHRHEITNQEESHTHLHEHAPLFHSHPHYPDVHHRHGHDKE